MKALLKILYFFFFVIILFVLAGLFLPKKTKIVTSISIGSSTEIVFDQINNIRNWDNWVPWHISDSSIKISYSENTKGVGASYEWAGNNSGEGKVIITESEPTSKIIAEMSFLNHGLTRSSWIIENDSNKTTVNWKYENVHLNYFERYFVIFFKKKMINAFESGLNKLKETSEELRLDRISEVKTVKVSNIRAITIIDSCASSEIVAKMEETFLKLTSYLERRHLDTIGKPFTVFKKWDNNEMKTFACALPIAERTWSWQSYQFMEIDSCEAIMVTHWGIYDDEKPFKALTQYINDKNMIIDGYPWEVYIKDQNNEADTSQWQTDIYFPVKTK